MSVYFLKSGVGGEDITKTNITRVITLEGISYDFNFRWNVIDESWVISVALVGSTPLFSVKVTTGRIFNDQYKHIEGSPQGELIVFDFGENYERLSFEDFSIEGRFRLVYIDSGGL